MARTWQRDPDEEDGDWAHRYYRSDDGWVLEREYGRGDRYLNRPSLAWRLHREGVSGYGDLGFYDTLKEGKAATDHPLADVYRRFTLGELTSREYETLRDELGRPEHREIER